MWVLLHNTSFTTIITRVSRYNLDDIFLLIGQHGSNKILHKRIVLKHLKIRKAARSLHF